MFIPVRVKVEVPSVKVMLQGVAPVSVTARLADEPTQKFALPAKAAEEEALIVILADPETVPAAQKSLTAVPV